MVISGKGFHGPDTLSATQPAVLERTEGNSNYRLCVCHIM